MNLGQGCFILQTYEKEGGGTIGIIKRFKDQLKFNIHIGTLKPEFTYYNQDLASNETIFSAVTMLSNAIASAPIALRQDYKKITPAEHPVARLCEYGFNAQMSTFKFIQCMEVLRNTTGAGYALKELDSKGNISNLWLMKTNHVVPVVERDTRELYYRINDDDGAYYIHESNIIAVSHISSDGIQPINPINVLNNTLKYDKEVKEFSINQMQNGLRSNVVVEINQNLSEQQLKTLDEMLSRFKKSGILYLDKGKSIQELKNTSIIDPKVFEVENITIARVARVYSIPLDKFLPDKASYSSAEQSDLNYLKDTILPLARMYEQKFTRKLLTEIDRDAGMQIKFSLNGFARADMETRGNFYFKGIRSSWFCADEIRALEDMPPLPNGKGEVFYISKDLVPVEQAGKGVIH